jgi:hypothetical protein
MTQGSAVVWHEAEIERLKKALVAKDVELDEAYARTADLVKSATEIIAEVEKWKRIAHENHAVIEGVLKERDQWNQMWRQHGIEHANAQQLMVAEIERHVAVIRQCYEAMNVLRKAQGMPAIDPPKSQSEFFEGLARQYREALEAGAASVPAIDWKAQRDAVAPPQDVG